MSGGGPAGRWPTCPRALSMECPTRRRRCMCYNDLAAIGLLAAAASAGLQVPGELSVIGYDNIPLSATRCRRSPRSSSRRRHGT